MTQTNPALQKSFEDYAENLDWLPDYFNDRFWEGGLDTEACFHEILLCARRENVEIIDWETVEFDSILYEWYKNTEKGLS